MKMYSESTFSIRALRVDIVVVVNGPVISMEKGTSVHPRIRGNNLVTIYVFPEGFLKFQTKYHEWMMKLGPRW